MADAADLAGHRLRGVFQEIGPVGATGFVEHPDELGGEAAGDVGDVVRVHQHVAAAQVDFVFEDDGDRHGREGFLQGPVEGGQFLDAGDAARGERHDFVAGLQDAGGELAGEAAEIEVGPDDVLDGETEFGEVAVLGDGRRFEMFEERRAFEPRGAGAAFDDVVAIERGDGEERQVLQSDVFGVGGEILLNLIEDGLAEFDQIHLVDGDGDVGNAEQRGDVGVAARLGQDALARVDQHDGEIGRGGAGGHVAGVLFVARRVGDDELALGRGEVAVGYVDGDALFAFGAEAIGEE